MTFTHGCELLPPVQSFNHPNFRLWRASSNDSRELLHLVNFIVRQPIELGSSDHGITRHTRKVSGWNDAYLARDRSRRAWMVASKHMYNDARTPAVFYGRARFDP